MVNPSIFKVMADYASLNQTDVVLDVGAGLGFLTRFLAVRCKTVLAVELDARLVMVLREQFKDSSNVKIIKGDVLRTEIPQFNKVVSIPPYHISSSLLLLLFNKRFDCAVLVFQKEFAERLVARIGSEDYGWLTVAAYYHVEVELLDKVSRWMFHPQPEVDSIVVRLRPKKPPPFTLKNEEFFRKLTQALFTHRNKKVKNAVLPLIKGMGVVNTEKTANLIPFRNKRVRELAPEDFGALANVFAR